MLMATRYVLLTLSLPEEEMDLALGVLSGYPLIGIEQGTDEFTICFEQNDWQADYAETIARYAEIPVEDARAYLERRSQTDVVFFIEGRSGHDTFFFGQQYWNN